MSDIFICYSRTDITIATQLQKQFEAAGWTVFIDKLTPIGHQWHREIEKELHTARAVVVLWSVQSRESEYVLEEAEYGKRKSILFPVLIDPVEFPYGFSRIQTANLVGWKGNESHPGLEELLNSLRIYLNTQEHQSGDVIPIGIEQTVNIIQPKPAQLISSVSPSSVLDKADKKKQERWNDKSPIRNFLLPTVLIALSVAIYPIVETLYEQWNKTELHSTSRVSQQEAPLDKSEAKKTQTQQPTHLNSDLLPELVLIRTGSFNMGEQDEVFIRTLDNDRKPFYGIPSKHIVINKSFFLGKTEVTNKQYNYYLRKHQSGFQIVNQESEKTENENQPVVNVNWQEAMAYAKWLGEQTKRECRLPTEAEWEYAAKAGNHFVYPWGNDLSSNNANCDGCGSQWDNKHPAPVSSFAANQFGLYDMSGNVWEWTCSAWRNQFNGEEQRCGENKDEPRVLRGGSWSDDSDYVRSSARLNVVPVSRLNALGFRVLCSPLINE